jgi:hypothetical protein
MSTAKLEIEWRQDGWDEQSCQLTDALVRFIARPRPQLRCPTCRSIIYTRRHRLCGVCGEELPVSHLFSVPEAQRVKHTLVIEQQRHRTWLSRQAS